MRVVPCQMGQANPRTQKQQVRTLVGGEATGEPQRQHVGIEDAGRRLGRFLEAAVPGQLAPQPLPGVAHQVGTFAGTQAP